MSHEPFTEVLSAFIDGEAVDPRDLEAALSRPEARGILLDFARLRRSVTDDATRPSAAFYRAMERSAKPTRVRLAGWWKPIAVPALVGVGVIVVASLLWLGLRPESRPPKPDRVVTFSSWEKT